MEVLVPAPRKVDQDRLVPAERGQEAQRPGQSVTALQRGKDALPMAERPKRGERLLVGHPLVAGPSLILQPGVFRPDAGIVEPRGYRVDGGGLPGCVRQDIAPEAVEDLGRP